jgi:hypothetical protein
MSANREPHLLSSEEKDFIDRVSGLYAPSPMTSLQRMTFDRTLTERLSRSARVPFLRPVAAIATVCAAVLLWFMMQHQNVFLPGEELSSEIAVVAPEDAIPETEEATLLAYAYYNPELYGEDSEDDSEDDEQFLPDEYEAIATALAFPDV